VAQIGPPVRRQFPGVSERFKLNTLPPSHWQLTYVTIHQRNPGHLYNSKASTFVRSLSHSCLEEHNSGNTSLLHNQELQWLKQTTIKHDQLTSITKPNQTEVWFSQLQFFLFQYTRLKTTTTTARQESKVQSLVVTEGPQHSFKIWSEAPSIRFNACQCVKSN